MTVSRPCGVRRRRDGNEEELRATAALRVRAYLANSGVLGRLVEIHLHHLEEPRLLVWVRDWAGLGKVLCVLGWSRSGRSREGARGDKQCGLASARAGGDCGEHFVAAGACAASAGAWDCVGLAIMLGLEKIRGCRLCGELTRTRTVSSTRSAECVVDVARACLKPRLPSATAALQWLQDHHMTRHAIAVATQRVWRQPEGMGTRCRPRPMRSVPSVLNPI